MSRKITSSWSTVGHWRMNDGSRNVIVSCRRTFAIIAVIGFTFVGSTRYFRWFPKSSVKHQGEQIAGGETLRKTNLSLAPHFAEVWEGLVLSSRKAKFAILWNRLLTLPSFTASLSLLGRSLNAMFSPPSKDDLESLKTLMRNHCSYRNVLCITCSARLDGLWELPQDLDSGSGS